MVDNNAREKTILDDPKMSLYGKPKEGAKGTPMLGFSVYQGHPAIIVFPNDPSDTNSRPIRAGMDQKNWPSFVQAIHNVAEHYENGSQVRIENYRGQPQKRFLDSVTIVGKSEEGVVYIALHQENRPTTKFELLPSPYMAFVDNQGNQIDKAKVSRMFAIGYMKLVDAYVSLYMKDTYVPFQQQQQQQKQSSGQGSGNDSMDDLPF